MPFLFQRAIGGLSVIAAGTVRDMLQRLCNELADTREGFARHKFTPHDFRRLFATDLVNSGLPIHIGAKLLGHLDLQTTQGYVAVFEEDLVRHHQDFLVRRRAQRPVASDARCCTSIRRCCRIWSSWNGICATGAPAPSTKAGPVRSRA
jgi:integrase